MTAKSAARNGLVIRRSHTPGALRNDLPLLDTRFPVLLMRASHFLLILLSLVLATAGSLPAQDSDTGGPPARSKPAAPPEPRISFSAVHVDEPYIAMTFDDGPHPTLTPKLLDLLAAHHIKATFFLIGQNVVDHPEIVQRAVREGHEVGNHSWSHPNLGKMSDDAVRSQLRRTDEVIKNAAGVRPTLFRPPYGSITKRQERWIHEEFGYDTILWDVDPLDWKRPGPMTVCNRIVKQTRPGSIVLSHDIHAQTIEAMPGTLSQLEERHFKFVTVSELIGLATPEPPKPAPAQRTHAVAPPASPPPGGSGMEDALPRSSPPMAKAASGD
jgi:peptidoglycan/xylan/chitin deacetylase (PgdA/CDA1 family)